MKNQITAIIIRHLYTVMRLSIFRWEGKCYENIKPTPYLLPYSTFPFPSAQSMMRMMSKADPASYLNIVNANDSECDGTPRFL